MFDSLVRGFLLIGLGASLIAKQLFNFDIFCYLSFNIIGGVLLIYLGVRALFHHSKTKKLHQKTSHKEDLPS